MGTREEGGEVRDAVRALLEKDRAAGGLKAAAHYKNLFPGFWDVVGEEYGAAAGARNPPGPPAAATTPGPGAVVADVPAPPAKPAARIGPYRIVRELGRGGMGVVYEAQDTRLPRRVALKVLSPQFASSAPLRLRFQREAELASRLDHPHVCTVYEAGEDDGTPYLAMRFVEGRPLSDLVVATRDRLRGTGAVHVPGKEGREAPGSGEAGRDIDRVLALFEKAARALHHAHGKGLIHRDIKPHNVMVTADGEPVLLDFGLAREEAGEGHRLTRTGSLLGTPAYMSPEQLMAPGIELDRRTDVYSLGVSLYECLTLRLPFEAPTVDGLYQRILTTEPEDPRRLNPGLSKDLGVVLLTALEKDRDRRYRSAEDLAEELRRVREREPVRARPVGSFTRLARWCQRSPAVAGALSALLLTLTGGLALSLDLLQAARMERDAKDRALARSVQDREAREKALGEVRAQHRRIRALALVQASALAGATDPMGALLLAREAGSLDLSVAVRRRLREAIRASKERLRFRLPGDARILEAAFHPSGEKVLLVGDDGVVHIQDVRGNPLASFPPPPAPRQVGDFPDSVACAAFSPAGDRLLIGYVHGRRIVVQDLEGRGIAVLRGPGGGLDSAIFSPRGDRVLACSRDGVALVWDLEGGEGVALRPDPPAKAPLGAAFLPDGKRILTWSNGAVTVWDLEGRALATFGEPAPGGDTPPVALSPSGDRVLGGAGGTPASRLEGKDGAEILRAMQGGARLWDLEGRELARFRGHGESRFVGFLLQGRYVLAADSSIARICDLRGDERGFLPADALRLNRVSIPPGGERILTVHDDGAARLWKCTLAFNLGWDPPFDVRCEEIASFRAEGGIREAALSPRGDLLLAVGGGSATLFELEERELARVPVEALRSVSFSRSGDRILAASGNGTVGLWDVEGRPLVSFPTGEVGVVSAAFAPDDGLVVAALKDGTARLWDREGNGTAVLRGHGKALTGACFSPDGGRVLTWSEDGTARLWTPAGREVAVLEGHADVIYNASYSPSGDRILTASNDGSARLWDSGGRLLRVLPHDEPVWSARFSPGGGVVATFSSRALSPDLVCDSPGVSVGAFYKFLRGTVRLFDPDGGELAALASQGSTAMDPFEFPPGGGEILVAEDPDPVRERGPAPDPLRLETPGGPLLVRRVATLPTFSPDGSVRLVSGGTVPLALRDAEGALLDDLPGLEAGQFLRFSPDGRVLLSGGMDGFRTWRVRGEDLLDLAARRSTRGFTPGERERYGDLLGEPAGAGR